MTEKVCPCAHYVGMLFHPEEHHATRMTLKRLPDLRELAATQPYAQLPMEQHSFYRGRDAGFVWWSCATCHEVAGGFWIAERHRLHLA